MSDRDDLRERVAKAIYDEWMDVETESCVMSMPRARKLADAAIRLVVEECAAIVKEHSERDAALRAQLAAAEASLVAADALAYALDGRKWHVLAPVEDCVPSLKAALAAYRAARGAK